MKRKVSLVAAMTCVLAACSTSTDNAAPLTPEGARSAFDAACPPQDGKGEGLSFQVGREITGVPNEELGRLASTSWDFYFVLDDGETGAWGAGMDVFATAQAADDAARKNAAFMACRDGERQPIAGFDFGSADFGEASWCHRAVGPGYIATASSAEGQVAANLTVGTNQRSRVQTALADSWVSLSRTADDVRSRIADRG